MTHFITILIAISFGLTFKLINGQISSRVITLLANKSQEYAIYDNNENPTEEWVRFITVGVHSQKYNLTLLKDNKTDNNSISGLNIGLVLMTDQDNGLIFIVNKNGFDVNALLIASHHGDNDPIPGGCNQEFPLEISPFLQLYDNTFINRLDYQFANIGSPKGYKSIDCDKSQLIIKYQIYTYFLRENDFSEEEYFRSISLMTNLSDIKDSASLLTNLSTTRSYFYSYPGRGIVYNIIASSENYSSAYVPIVTYDCDNLNDCSKQNVMALVIVVSYGLIGFLVCLRGHLWFQTQTLFFGLIDGSFVAFVLLSKYTDLSETQTSIYTLAIGIGASLLWLFIWKILNIPVLSLLLSGLSLGFLLIATVLFTTIGNLDVFHNDMNYWLIMSCTSLLITLFLLMVNAIVLSVVSTSIVGSYVSVVAIDRFIGGSLSYIILNVVKRALFHYTAFNNVPFQNKDIVLTILWILLSLTGIVLQMSSLNDRNRTPFPAPTSCSHPHRERRRSRRALHEIEEPRSSIQRNNSLRNRRWSPVPTAPPERSYDRVVDERSSLLYSNYNIYTNSNNRVTARRDSPPPDYEHSTNTNQREYLTI